MKLNLKNTALTFGLLVSLMHVVWLGMVYFGVAQFYMDWILGLHQVSLPIKVLPFNWMNAFWLVIFTFVIGYLMGFVFAFFWNRLHKK